MAVHLDASGKILNIFIEETTAPLALARTYRRYMRHCKFRVSGAPAGTEPIKVLNSANFRGKGGDEPARILWLDGALECPIPEAPDPALVIDGQSAIRLFFNDRGTVAQTQREASSGYVAFDQAAELALSRCRLSTDRWQPALEQEGLLRVIHWRYF